MISLAKVEIDTILKNEENLNFENIIEALSFRFATLYTISNIFFNLKYAVTTDKMQKIAQEVFS